MKGARKKKELLDQLRKNSNKTYVCNKVGISRQTFYRWSSEDKEFKDEVESAIIEGEDYMNDFVENKLMEGIQKGESKQIQYYLTRRHPKYMEKKPDPIIEKYKREENNKKLILELRNIENELRLKKFKKKLKEPVTHLSGSILKALFKEGRINYLAYENGMKYLEEHKGEKWPVENFDLSVDPEDVMQEYIKNRIEKIKQSLKNQ